MPLGRGMMRLQEPGYAGESHSGGLIRAAQLRREASTLGVRSYRGNRMSLGRGMMRL